MFGGIDLLRLFDWSMIEPEDDVVVIIKLGAGDRNRFVGVVGEYGERTCCVEAHSSNRDRIDVVLAQNTLYGGANAAPDVVGRLLL